MRLLFQYRITPHTTTGLSPSEMLLGRKLRFRLDLLKPDLQQKLQEKQLQEKVNRDKWRRKRDSVCLLNNLDTRATILITYHQCFVMQESSEMDDMEGHERNAEAKKWKCAAL